MLIKSGNALFTQIDKGDNKPNMNIILHEPEIPLNTGNIGRTCVLTGSKLHLIRPLGFLTDDASLKRAGLDYWHELDITYYDNFEHFLELNPLAVIYMATTKAKNIYTDVNYNPNSFIMFGKESAGIPEEILVNYKETAIRIPMIQGKRSLNLSNSVAIVLYEALRQNNFDNLTLTGQLHRLSWD